MWLEFIEFNGVDRAQSRGATQLQLRTQDVDAVVEAARRARLRIESRALIADPNNFFLSLYESAK